MKTNMSGPWKNSGVAVLLTYLLTYLLTHSLTPWCRILFEMLIVTHIIKKNPAFFIITVLKKARHWTQS
jgi:hypothetical protein